MANFKNFKLAVQAKLDSLTSTNTTLFVTGVAKDDIWDAYLVNTMNGKVGQFLGKTVGYGLPYSTQFSNPQKFGTTDGGQYGARNPYTMPQP